MKRLVKLLQMVRRAFLGRHGGYPVLFPIPYEPLGWIALAAFSGWAYRHRSAFWPFALTAAAFLTAADLHAHHRRWWVTIAAITAVVTVVLGVPHRVLWARPAGKIAAGLLAKAWEKCGIDRPEERVYFTAVIATIGGWLAAATAISPFTKPLPLIAGIATVLLGIPWWGAPPQEGTGPRLPHDTNLAHRGGKHGPARLTYRLHRGRRVGLDRPRHPQERKHTRTSDQSPSRHRIRARHKTRQRPGHPRPPTRGQVHPAGDRNRPARAPDPLARPHR